MGLEGKAEVELTGTVKCTNMLSNFSMPASLKANSSKCYIKRSEISPKRQDKNTEQAREAYLGGADIVYTIHTGLLTVPSTSVDYTLTFTGLHFCSFCGSVAVRESFIPRKFRPVWQRVCVCKTIVSQKCKNAKMLAVR